MIYWPQASFSYISIASCILHHCLSSFSFPENTGGGIKDSGNEGGIDGGGGDD